MADLEYVRVEWDGELAIVTGRCSGLVVVDCDSPRDANWWQEQFPQTPLAVFTGGTDLALRALRTL